MLVTAQILGTFGGGGAERAAYNLGLGLRSEGRPCLGIAIRSAGEYAGKGELRVISLDAGDGGWWRALRAMCRLRRVIRRERIGLLHVHGSASLPFCAVVMLGMRRRPRLWFTWHDSGQGPDGSTYRGRLLYWALRRCERVSGASREIARRLSQIPGLTGRVEVFRNGVPDSLERLPDDGSEPVILWMARFVPAKDPQILIRAAARLRDEGLKFRVVMAGSFHSGGGAFMKDCRRLIHDLHLESIISLPGWIGDAASLIRSASIGVQTSHTEGLSMTLLEEMMVGLCVVATDVGDTALAVDHGRTGLLIPPRDDQALTDALRRLIVDSDLRSRYGAAARERAQAEFSLKAMAR